MGLTIQDLICCWPKLVYGRACCVWNCLFSPCVLSMWAISIYFFGCLKVYFNRTFYKVCCCFCRILNCCYFYNDKQFPPNETSLGKVGGDTANEESGQNSAVATCIWLRANQFPGPGKAQLFGETIDSRDVCQGALGDCWLLAAMACVAEHKGAVNSVFLSKERNPRGKYRLRLFNGVTGKWERVTIDDMIPCERAPYEKDGTCRPLFTQPNKNALWAMLLEKAFAKFCGGFDKIEGGQTIWAIRAMTGDRASWFAIDEDKRDLWTRFDLVNVDNPNNKRESKLNPKGEKIENDTMFEVLLKYHKLGSVLCASGSSGKDGLHKGHAYSILQVKKVNTGMLGVGGDTFRLVQIRNPWGTGEWQGDWGDKSDLWNKNPAVKKAVNYQDVDDGSFWMSWEDYCKNWSKIGIVDRSIDITSLGLPLKNDSMVAPCSACCVGCCRYWCCCQGVSHLYFPHRSSDETIKVGGFCGFCQKKAAVTPV